MMFMLMSISIPTDSNVRSAKRKKTTKKLPQKNQNSLKWTTTKSLQAWSAENGSLFLLTSVPWQVI